MVVEIWEKERCPADEGSGGIVMRVLEGGNYVESSNELFRFWGSFCRTVVEFLASKSHLNGVVRFSGIVIHCWVKLLCGATVYKIFCKISLL